VEAGRGELAVNGGEWIENRLTIRCREAFGEHILKIAGLRQIPSDYLGENRDYVRIMLPRCIGARLHS